MKQHRIINHPELNGAKVKCHRKISQQLVEVKLLADFGDYPKGMVTSVHFADQLELSKGVEVEQLPNSRRPLSGKINYHQGEG